MLLYCFITGKLDVWHKNRCTTDHSTENKTYIKTFRIIITSIGFAKKIAQKCFANPGSSFETFMLKHLNI